MEVRNPDLLAGLPPADCRIEVSAMPRLPVLVDKHQPVRAVGRVGVQVVLEFRQDGGREGDHAVSGLRFRRPKLKTAWHGKELSANAERASFQIKIIPGERRDLSPAERSEGLKEQESLPPI